jgi:hypothetical protein
MDAQQAHKRLTELTRLINDHSFDPRVKQLLSVSRLTHVCAPKYASLSCGPIYERGSRCRGPRVVTVVGAKQLPAAAVVTLASQPPRNSRRHGTGEA